MKFVLRGMNRHNDKKSVPRINAAFTALFNLDMLASSAGLRREPYNMLRYCSMSAYHKEGTKVIRNWKGE